ncbi:MAG: hypothetical protein RIB01_15220 [Balneola sp.]
MEEYQIEDSIEKKPTILGIKSAFFFIMVGATLLGIFTAVNLKSFLAAVIVMFILSGLWIYFWFKTNDFEENKFSDSQVPDIINCNPEQE